MIQIVKISKVKSNPNNPRIIKDAKYQKLKRSIEEFPDMLNKRPLVCCTYENGYMVIGGNMRLKASQELGLKEIPIMLADDWTDEQKKEFIIKDNVGFGEWDWDLLANEWDAEELSNWGLDVWKPEEQDLEPPEIEPEEPEPRNKIVVEYNEEDYYKVVAKFDSLDGSKENIVWNLLNL